MKRRITFVVDDDERRRYGLSPLKADVVNIARTGVTFESEEVIPEPDRVQEFTVRIVTAAEDPPFTVDEVEVMVTHTLRRRFRQATVTEVQS